MQRANQHTRSSNSDQACTTQHAARAASAEPPTNTAPHPTTQLAPTPSPDATPHTSQLPTAQAAPAHQKATGHGVQTRNPRHSEATRVSLSFSSLPFFSLGAGQCARRTGLFCCGQDCTRVCFLLVVYVCALFCGNKTGSASGVKMFGRFVSRSARIGGLPVFELGKRKVSSSIARAKLNTRFNRVWRVRTPGWHLLKELCCALCGMTLCKRVARRCASHLLSSNPIQSKPINPV